MVASPFRSIDGATPLSAAGHQETDEINHDGHDDHDESMFLW
jgi:hypothetical protein